VTQNVAVIGIFNRSYDGTGILKARTVEPEKGPLLANGSETTFVSSQRLGKHVPAATDTHATIKVILETVFCTRSVQLSDNNKDLVVSPTRAA
jgi:hypothetical protein